MSEQIYDEQVAPGLLELVRLCDEHDMCLTACVEYAPGDIASTNGLTEPKSAAQYIARAASLCRGNFDTLAIAVCRKYDTAASMVLNRFNAKET